jgi:hypothetical protein
MGLLITPNETPIKAQAMPIELESVYGRVRYTATPDGRHLAFEVLTWFNKAKYDEETDRAKGLFEQAKFLIVTDMPLQSQVVQLEEGVKQDNEIALNVAKAYIESLGYNCEIV